MPGPCSVDGCNEHGMVYSRRHRRKFCLPHYVETVMPLIEERRQNADWADARVYSSGAIVEIHAANRQEWIEEHLGEPYLQRAVDHHRGIMALLA